jgi:hypothetical protein
MPLLSHTEFFSDPCPDKVVELAKTYILSMKVPLNHCLLLIITCVLSSIVDQMMNSIFEDEPGCGITFGLNWRVAASTSK